MKTTAFWAGYYGFRSDASEAFIRGYLDEVQRLDQRGQGVACGRGWIPRSKKCSRDKASATPKEAKARTAEKARERAKLKGEVKAAKGQRARVKEKPEPKQDPFLSKEERDRMPEDLKIAHDFMVEKGFYSKDPPDIDLSAIGNDPDKLNQELLRVAQTKKVLDNQGRFIGYDPILIKSAALPYSVKAEITQTHGKNKKGGSTYTNISFPMLNRTTSKSLGITTVAPAITTIKVGGSDGKPPSIKTDIDNNRYPREWSEYQQSRRI